MFIAISKIRIRRGHIDKVISVIQKNANTYLKYKGCKETYIAQSVDDTNEILVYTLWDSQTEYEEAKKRVKKDSRTTKLMFQLLPHLAEEPNVWEFLVINPD